MTKRPILYTRPLRLQILPNAPWLAQDGDPYSFEHHTSLTPYYTPLLTTGVSEGQVTAWAPSDKPPQVSEEANFTQATRAHLLERAWVEARAHTPSLGPRLRWLKNKPLYDLFKVLVGNTHLDLKGESMGVSLLIGYITWLSELPPLRSVAVSVSLTSSGLEGVELGGLRHKISALLALPALRELVVYQSQEAEARQLTRDTHLSVTAVSSLDELVTHLWGDECVSQERALMQLKEAINTPQAFERHLHQVERHLRSSQMRDLPLLNHILMLERLPHFNSIFQKIKPIQQAKFSINKRALSRHLGKILPPTPHEREVLNFLGQLATGEVEERDWGLEPLSVGFKQEWVAEYLQNIQDQTAHESLMLWEGWTHHLTSEQSAMGSINELSHLIERQLSREDDSPGRAKLLGCFARLKLHQGRFHEAHTRSLEAIKGWELIAQEHPDMLNQLSYPLSVSWRSLRFAPLTEHLQGLIEQTERWLGQEQMPQEGVCFVAHEVLRTALWYLTSSERVKPEEKAWLTSTAAQLTAHVLTSFETQLGLVSHSSLLTPPHLSTMTCSLAEQLCQMLSPGLTWAPHVIGSACGAIFKGGERLAQLGLFGVQECCDRIWEELMCTHKHLSRYVYAQRALAKMCSSSLRTCEWAQLQGVTLLAHIWLAEGYSVERVSAFFDDPASDQELLRALKLRAIYLS